jgi:hypothetical protein
MRRRTAIWYHSLFACLVGLAMYGCEKAPPGFADRSEYSVYSMDIEASDVPLPEDIPFQREDDRAEYIRFFQSAYLSYANDPLLYFSSTISPVSDRPEAAKRGHLDGQDAAREAKLRFFGITHGRFRMID